MDFRLTPAEEAFRAELREWLAKHLTDDLRVDDPSDDRVASDRETFERRKRWQHKMADARWVGISWPKEYGGRGATIMQIVLEPPPDVTPRELLDELIRRVELWLR